ncbi:MAG: 5'-methylthioadenosine/adenosylhomocysteine nucleosidase [Campylobacteraceae bacterium]|jgi:adenosylhomocysteine/aminodeoxyfutalosine nucleosidase|nr:5'-methylthioadenosine/adenosylhomocysteine nucleosidase [Campylobacteraceae bacterium]
MNIAIMGAMVEEITPLLERFGEYKTVEIANNKFYTLKYKNIDVTVAYSKIGKVNAALTASILINRFGAEKLLFSGVAGAIRDDLHIGDLIAAEALVQHDLDITVFGHPYGFVPESKVLIKADTKLLKAAQETAKALNLTLKSGIIATGDQFICDGAKKEWIRKTFEADAIEMEGAGVAFVCDALNIPFFILRAISDAADAHAGFDFDEFLQSSSKISADFIISMLDKLEKQI